MPQLEKDFIINYTILKDAMPKGPDVVIRRFLIGQKQEAALFYLDNMADKLIIGEHILKPLMRLKRGIPLSAAASLDNIIETGAIGTAKDIDALITAALSGTAVLIIDGCEEGLIMDVVRLNQRGVSEPATDVVIRGPREGFVEVLRVNLSLLRKKIHHPELVFETERLGRYSKTEIALIYIEGVVNRGVLEEIRKRLRRIDIDGVLESGYIEELIRDNPWSPFPQVGNTEKPDILAAKILEGRVGLLIDGSPVALTMPMLFVEGFQSSEDYYNNFYFASIIRMVRYIAFLISVFLPAVYVAIVNYHQEIIPLRILLTMAAAEENMPFSPAVGILVMGLVYEILKESGVRLPRPVGQAISIVGALVMGQAAVSAGLISAPVLIVVAITVIASFVTVPLVGLATIFRGIFFFAAWALGSFGLLVALLAAALYLASLRSFGAPYFAPVAPLFFSELGDVFLRLPLWLLQKRPRELSANRRRMAADIKKER